MEEESKVRGEGAVLEGVEGVWIAEAFRQEQRLREAGSVIHKTAAAEADGQAYLWLRLEGYKDETTQSSGWSWALNKNLEEYLWMIPKQFNSGAEQRDQPPGFHLRRH